MHAGQAVENPRYLIHRENDGKPGRNFRSRHTVEPRQLHAQDFPVKEEQRGLGLVLRGGRNLALDGEVREKRLDFRRAKACRVPLAVK